MGTPEKALMPFRIFGVDDHGVFVEVGASTLAGAVVLRDMYTHSEFRAKIWNVYEERFLSDSEILGMQRLLQGVKAHEPKA